MNIDWTRKERIGMSSNTFEGLRATFDDVMQKMITNMFDMGSDDAKITISIDIAMDTWYTAEYDDDGNELPTRHASRGPSFKYKVASAISVKNERTGKDAVDGMELVWDETEKRYVLVPAQERQLTLGDYQAFFEAQEANDEVDDEVDTEVLLEEEIGDTGTDDDRDGESKYADETVDDDYKYDPPGTE